MDKARASGFSPKNQVNPKPQTTAPLDRPQMQPFFRRFRDDRLMDVSGGSAAAAEYATRAQVLAEAIPALSVAAGRNPITGFDDRNISMMDLKDGWPRADGRWRHSDAKNVAYRFNHRLWETWVQLGGLK